MRIALMQFYSSRPTPPYRRIAAALRQKGHTVWVATPNDAGALVWEDGDRVVAVQERPALPGATMRLPLFGSLLERLLLALFFVRVRRFLSDNDVDMVQLNPALTHSLWALRLGLAKRPRFLLDWRQIDEREYRGWLGAVMRSLTAAKRQFYSRVVFDRASFLHAAGARQVLGPEWQKWAEVIPLAVDEHFLYPRHNGTGRHGRPVRFVYLGTLSRIRKLEHLLEAAQRVLAESDQFELHLIGPERTQGFYAEKIRELGLEAVVKILPPVAYDDVPGTIGGYDVALAYVPERPLDWQYHPTLKVLEYRALGIPIIATNFEPNCEVVQDNVNGLLVTNTVADWAGAMLRFVNDPEFLTACRHSAGRMREGNVWCEVADMYIRALYEK